MNKLFSLFIKYSILPEKEFLKKASHTIYSIANYADQLSHIGFRVRSQPNFLNISIK